MNLSGHRQLPVKPTAVLFALTDETRLGDIVPDAASVRRVGERSLVIKLLIPAAGDARTAAARLALEPARGLAEGGEALAVAFLAETESGLPLVQGTADIQLAPDVGGTLLSYEAQLSFPGALLSPADPGLNGRVAAFADAVLARLAQGLGPAEATRPAPPDEGLGPQIWLVGLIAVVLILIAVFSIIL